MTRQQSSEYLHISLSSVHGVRSAAVTMNAAGPRAEPRITLAEILVRLDIEPTVGEPSTECSAQFSFSDFLNFWPHYVTLYQI